MTSYTKISVMLVFYGCASHYNDDIIMNAIEMRNMLILLPVNDTHPVQSFDAATFKAFSTTLKKEIYNQSKEASSPSLTKIEAIDLSVKAWEEGETRRLDNIVLVFISSEIWPPNFNLMVNRLDIYQGVGLPKMLEETK